LGNLTGLNDYILIGAKVEINCQELTLRAALLFGKEDIRLQNVHLSQEMESVGLLLKMRASGICGSDSRMFFNGPTSRYINPVILGHELSAEVVAIGPNLEGYQIGDLVTIAPVIPCMRCINCSDGKDNICLHAQVIGCNAHGGMAEYFYASSQLVSAGGIVKLPKGIGYQEGALAELVGCALHGWREVGFEPGDRVMILGDGPIGITFLQLAKLMGASWIGISGCRDFRLNLAVNMGAEETFHADRDKLKHIERGSIDRTIVATSDIEALKMALDFTRPGGHLLLFSGYIPGTTMDLPLNDIHYREIHIHSSIDCTIKDFQNATNLLPQLDMKKLITSTYQLEDTVQAFHATKDQEQVKVLLDL
jgi:L-iditol 2-dehydrogenase